MRKVVESCAGLPCNNSRLARRMVYAHRTVYEEGGGKLCRPALQKLHYLPHPASTTALTPSF